LEEKLKIGMLLRMLYISVKVRCDKDMKDIELTSSQSEVLGYLLFSQGREVNQKDIEQELRLMNPTVTGILNRLEKKGFITRIKSNTDGRYKRVELTAKGREISEAMMMRAMEMENRLLVGLSQAEIDSFGNTIRKLIENISK